MKTQHMSLGHCSRFTPVALFGALLGLVGCGGDARSPADFEQDTQKMLEGSSPAITNCYNAALQKKHKLDGSVTVTFTIVRGSGHVKKPKVDAARTTGGDELKKCVVDNIQDLKLDPADANHGEATFTWVFNASDGSPPVVAPAEAPAS